jgi:hypothetical protein
LRRRAALPATRAGAVSAGPGLIRRAAGRGMLWCGALLGWEALLRCGRWPGVLA